MTKINFSNVSDLKPIPPGEYEATLSEFSPVKNSSTGKPMSVLTFVVQDEDYQGRKLWQNMSLANEALPFAKRTLTRLGADPEIFSDPEGFEVEDVLGQLIGVNCRLVVTVQEYPAGSGEYKNQVKEVKASTGSMFG